MDYFGILGYDLSATTSGLIIDFIYTVGIYVVILHITFS